VLAFYHAVAIGAFQILNVLVEPIKASIQVSDTQYSLIQGLAVAVFASMFGVPAAIVADRGRRRSVVITGVLIWSAATLACAFSRSFEQFFAARMAVGLGEALLFPAALSIIADVAPPNRFASAVGLFGCGGPVGTAAALIGGGWMVGHQTEVAHAWPTLYGEVWRTTFLICAAAGAVAVGLLLTIAEPRRHRMASAGPATGLGATLAFLGQRRGLFAGVSGGMLALSFCAFATSAWAPTVLVRDHGLNYAQAGRITGLAAMLGGVGGAWLVGLATDWAGAGGRRDGPILVAIGVAALIGLTITAAVLWPSANGAAAFLFLNYALLGMPTVLGGVALQQISPPPMRAQVMAIQVLLVNLLALSAGPWAVATLTDKLFASAKAVGWSLAWADALAAAAAIVALMLSRRAFAAMRAADQR